MKFQLVQNLPCPAQLAPALDEIARRTGVVYNSIDRSQEAVNWARSKGINVTSQAELYNGWIQRLPGYNPANPPGRSTHERRNDGVAYAGPVGMPLRWWQVGVDNTHSAAVVATARTLGWVVTVTYPGDPREGHHVNFRKEPRINIVPLLHKGSKGKQVTWVARSLAILLRPGKRANYLPWKQHGKTVFDAELEHAIKQFQADHHQVADGIVGPNTRAQLKTSMRWHREHIGKPPKPKPQGPRRRLSHPVISGKINGPDTNSFQPPPDWDRIRHAGCELAVQRCTMGVRGAESYDTQFTRQSWAAISHAGLIRGEYHYARPAHDRTGAQEAQHNIDRVRACGGFKPGDLLPVFDLEQSELSPEGTKDWAESFVMRIKRELGVLPIIYTGSFWREHMPLVLGAWGCPLWLAAYVDNPDPFVPVSWKRAGRSWSMWQTTERGRVPGVGGNVDLNVVRDAKTLDRLRFPYDWKDPHGK